MVTGSFVLIAATSVASAQPVPDGAMDGSALVRPTVMAEHRSIGPEAPTALAIRFQVQDGWHVYWRNPGDTGAEMTVNYKGPDWASIGDLQWPVPERYRSPGDLLDFVHHGAPVLLTELRIDADKWASAGSPDLLKFELAFEWFVCKDICLLGEGSTSIEIPIAEEARARREVTREHAAAFRSARSALPVPHDQVEPGTYTAAFEDHTLTIHAPGADRLTFFAYESPQLAVPENSLRDAQQQGDRLSIRYREAASSQEYLWGVLVIERRAGERSHAVTKAVEVKVPVQARKTSHD